MSKDEKPSSYKSALKQEVTFQLENALGKLKDLLGEKKFNARVKKAVKLITEGIKEEKKAAKDAPAEKPAKEKAVVVANETKTAAKKTAVKAPAKKKAAPKKVATLKKQTEDIVSK